MVKISSANRARSMVISKNPGMLNTRKRGPNIALAISQSVKRTVLVRKASPVGSTGIARQLKIRITPNAKNINMDNVIVI